jgi:hypothetical protein
MDASAAAASAPTVLTSTTNAGTIKTGGIMHCWNCGFDIPDGRLIVGIPYHENTLLGQFCTAACAARYINDTMQLHTCSHYLSALQLWYSQMVGTPTEINAAPHKSAIIEYGGSLSIEEYRQQTDNFTVLSGSLSPEFRRQSYVVVQTTEPNCASLHMMREESSGELQQRTGHYDMYTSRTKKTRNGSASSSSRKKNRSRLRGLFKNSSK